MSAKKKTNNADGGGSPGMNCSRGGVDWFSRGRDAYTEGKRCFFDDARVRGDQRQSWYDGWHHQARLNNSSKISDEDRAEVIAELQKIRDAIREND